MRAFRLLIGALISTLTLGCVDIDQHLSRDPSGEVRVSFKATMSRATIDLANALSDSDETLTADDMVDLRDSDTDRIVRIFNGRVFKIDDGTEVGFGVELVIDLSSDAAVEAMREQTTTVVPDISEEAIVISFPGEGLDPEEDAMAIGVLSSYRYRLTISRDVMSTISRVVLIADGVDYKPHVVRLMDAFRIDVPMNYLASDPDGCQLVVYR